MRGTVRSASGGSPRRDWVIIEVVWYETASAPALVRDVWRTVFGAKMFQAERVAKIAAFPTRFTLNLRIQTRAA